METLPRGTGFQFENQIVGGVIPRNFIPSIEKVGSAAVRPHTGQGETTTGPFLARATP